MIDVVVVNEIVVIESAQTTIVYNLVDHKMVAVVKRIRVCQSRIQDHADLAPTPLNVFVSAQSINEQWDLGGRPTIKALLMLKLDTTFTHLRCSITHQLSTSTNDVCSNFYLVERFFLSN